ncbi:MAG: XRE family transcriptional regulator [Salinibacterium sp.]|nr:MAG: XRE family transcriptional regulator [Salinibacterium sp.]
MTEPALVFGRVVATFRAAEDKTQGDYATELGWDRSVLARIEVGRNDVSIANVLDIEAMLIKHGLITTFGQLVQVTSEVTAELKARPKINGDAPAVVDRIAGTVVDRWLQKRTA